MKFLYGILILTCVITSAFSQDIDKAKRTQAVFENGDIITSTTGNISSGQLNKSTLPYQEEICAIYVLDKFQHNAVQIAEKGIVHVKFSSKNGEVRKGDYVTSSDVPGTAMKATQSGMIIGVALEESSNKGLLKILVQPSWVNQ